MSLGTHSAGSGAAGTGDAMRLWPHSPERRRGGTLGNAGQEGPAGRRAASTAARRWGAARRI